MVLDSLELQIEREHGMLNWMKAPVPPDEQIRELLTSRGLRVTEQRVTLLRELAKTKAPISHPELTDRVTGSGLDRATVYRNLLTLADAGVLIRAQLGDQVWRYELPKTMSSDHAHHPHLVCSECGNVRCLPAGTVKLHGEAAKSEVAEVQLRGRCAACVGA
ncbi:MAG: Fur family transcriptional regulator [Myxococcota bacterium]